MVTSKGLLPLTRVDSPMANVSLLASIGAEPAEVRERIGTYLLRVRRDWAALSAEPGQGLALEDFLAERSRAFMEQFDAELRAMAAAKIRGVQTRESYSLSADTFIHEFWIQMLRDPERLLIGDSVNEDPDVYRRVFLGGFYLALNREIVNRGRRERAFARDGALNVSGSNRTRARLRVFDWEPDDEMAAPAREGLVAELDLEDVLMALIALEKRSSTLAEVARMRLLGDPSAPQASEGSESLSHAEIGSALGITPRKSERLWADARAWLRDELARRAAGPQQS